MKESLVGSELVFFIRNKNAFYNASFQKIAQLDLEEDLYYRDSDVSVTKMEILFSVSGILWTTDNIKFMIIKAYY